MYAQFSRKIKRNGMYPKAKCLSRRPVILHGRLITKNILKTKGTNEVKLHKGLRYSLTRLLSNVLEN